MKNPADSRRNGALLAGVALFALILLASSLQGTARGQGPVTAEPSLTAIPMPLATITYAPNIEIITGGIGKYGSRICWVGQYCPELNWLFRDQPQENQPQENQSRGGFTLVVVTVTPTGASLPYGFALPQTNTPTPNEASDVLPPCTDLIDPSFYRDHYAPDWRPVFVVERDMGDYIQLIPICN